MSEPSQPSEPFRIVREPDLPGIAAATRAVLAELTRARPAGQWATDHLAPMLAGNAIAADDDHGRTHDYVVQADKLRWPELLVLADVIVPALDFDRHMTTNAVHTDCPQCTAIQAHRRITGYLRHRTIGPDTPRPAKRPAE
jgi:hypothetical protein